MGSLRYVCTASTSTGPAIHWSVYLREEAQRLDLGNSTAGCFEISLTSFSQCVIQSTLTIDQNCGLVGEDDIITCTANSGSVNVSQHIHQGMTITNSGLAYFKDFTINENIKNDNHPFICKMVDPRF
ncbi:uncharacterized protein LOC110975975 [Acanthaster planci]|uniref:Uncharacterized protein LOC110975975 n=1 Tax=Acanthaster planci TaxID=133434 RepID=A0A8B7XWD1_ACAPL|nr:uncharacterized protein LOC110975975 [Acanthaster planci]